MAKRSDEQILTDFDSYVVNPNIVPPPHTCQTMRDRLELEVLLDMRDYLQKIKNKLEG